MSRPVQQVFVRCVVVLALWAAGCGGESGGLPAPSDAGADGGAACSVGQVECDGTCTDPRSDPDHCGVCESSCAADEVCAMGACAPSCSGGLSECDRGCRDLRVDRDNCGTCGMICEPGRVCSLGSCELSCGGGRVDCAGVCRDLMTDRNHCGACGTSCGAGEVCSGAACGLSHGGGDVVTSLDVSLLDGGDINGDGTADGLKLNGITGSSAVSLGDHAGVAVSILGDLDGDGLADLAIGANLQGAALHGAVYAVFGSRSLSTLANGTVGFDLGLLDGRQGLAMLGGAAGDRMGERVAAAGDLDGDGLADLIFGDSRADTAAPVDPPEAHVLCGDAAVGSLHTGSGFSVDGFDGSNGANLSAGPSASNQALVVSGIGDVDGDGMDDLMVGQLQQTPNGTDSGRAWLVFGDADGDGVPDHDLLDIADLDLPAATAAMGVLPLDGPAADASIGRSITAIGDIDGNGFDDFLLGSTRISGDKGRAYVLFGDTRANLQAEFAAIDAKTGAYAPSGGNNGGLEALDGSNGGIALTSDSDFFSSQGKVVTGIGDFDGDGFDDFAVAGPESSGAITTVVFGHGGPWTNLNMFSGFNSVAEAGAGFHIGASAGASRLGTAVSGGGDVNGDGYDDLVVTEPGTHSAYVLFGTGDISPFITTGAGFVGGFLGPMVDLKPSGATSSPFESGGVLHGQGLVLNGVPNTEFGAAASMGGDVNGDGYDDILIGAPFASPATSTQFGAGQSYLIYGQGFSGGIPVSPVSRAPGADGQAMPPAAREVRPSRR